MTQACQPKQPAALTGPPPRGSADRAAADGAPPRTPPRGKKAKKALEDGPHEPFVSHCARDARGTRLAARGPAALTAKELRLEVGVEEPTTSRFTRMEGLPSPPFATRPHRGRDSA